MPVLDIKFTADDVLDICRDLHQYIDINEKELLDRINTSGPLEMAIHYGYKPTSYRYHQLGGRIGYKALLLNLTSDITSFLSRAKHLLRPEIAEYINNN